VLTSDEDLRNLFKGVYLVRVFCGRIIGDADSAAANQSMKDTVDKFRNLLEGQEGVV
jgi:hypothetical protein